MPTMLTDVFRGHPIHLPHSHQPDFTSLSELPDSYTWTPKDDPLLDAAPCPPAASENIPLIDLNHPDAANQIGSACRTWGAFQIANHGVPLELLQGIEFLTGSLFQLPVQRKLKAARSDTGFSGYGVARISSFFNKQMWSEGFTITGSPLNDFRKLWPQHHLKNYCDIVEEYEEQMQTLASKLMWLSLTSLGVSEEDIKWATANPDLNWAQSALQLNHYPVCPEPDRAMGLAAHTDSTLLTILHQNNTAGLQVFRDDLGWVTVPPVPGSLVVNVGDLFHILSNGLFKSVLHRARVNQTRSRFSVAFLWGPQSDIKISPVPKLVSPVESPLYRSVTWTEYLRTKATHFNEALSMIRNHIDE
ncbi:Gibberellin 3-beta-dioxygenase 1 [Raphanus sativus]|uniref:gibberellin 3beta-dioxygenase n=1 Tax=Raphanus sativus TaxID=3726 RepID=A0A6J0N460_RAPSA|nr:gibberellin 3-beta-dioxygenase 1 [Raphanus sativus]KAJ4915884.1 Gibberellin 3-beta-dioxygenase 1 [Raphanus sativus]